MPPESRPQRGLKSPKMPPHSTFYDTVLPILLVVLGIVMLGLIVFAIGVLAGIIPWR